MELFWYLIFFFFGASIGSFVNVVLDRYNTGLRFWQGKSFCFSCNFLLKKIHMVPVLSFLFLRGRCSNCGSKIPHESFIIELLMGVLSILLVFKFGFLNSDFSWMLATSYLLLLSIFASIVLISFYDLRHMIIPDSFLLTFILLSFIYNSLSIIHNSILFLGTISFKLLVLSLITNVASGILLALPFFIIFLLSKGRWIGFGDIKYIAVIGFFLGLINGSSAIILAFWIGAVFSVCLLLTPIVLRFLGLSKIQNSFKINSAIPFGPFLSLGIIVSFYLNIDILQIEMIKDLFYGIL